MDLKQVQYNTKTFDIPSGGGGITPFVFEDNNLQIFSETTVTDVSGFMLEPDLSSSSVSRLLPRDQAYNLSMYVTGYDDNFIYTRGSSGALTFTTSSVSSGITALIHRIGVILRPANGYIAVKPIDLGVASTGTSTLIPIKNIPYWNKDPIHVTLSSGGSDTDYSYCSTEVGFYIWRSTVEGGSSGSFVVSLYLNDPFKTPVTRTTSLAIRNLDEAFTLALPRSIFDFAEGYGPYAA